MNKLILHAMRRKFRFYCFCLITIFGLIIFWHWVQQRKSLQGSESTDYKSQSTIVVGVYPNHSLKEVEVLIEGYEPLQYYIDGVFLDEGDEGVKKLLAELKRVKTNHDITVLNPATAWIGGVGHRPGMRDYKYKYPLVRNIHLRSEVKSEIDRIRGWSDDTQPDVPWKE